jgi:hypothetical protein
MKHKHAELIKAWADGATIEAFLEPYGIWVAIDNKNIRWEEHLKFRIKSEPKPNYKKKYYVYHFDRPCIYPCTSNQIANIVLTFDGTTDELKDAKVI